MTMQLLWDKGKTCGKFSMTFV